MKQNRRMLRNALEDVAVRMAEECVKTIKSGSNEMSVNMCAILDGCACGGDNCYSDEKNKRSKKEVIK